MTVAIESPLQDDVRELVSALSAHLLPLSPREFQFGIGVEEMAEPRTTVFVARDENGVAVGCGALTVHDDGTGEVKRMFTVLEARCARVGEKVLSAIIELARRHRLERLLLETARVRISPAPIASTPAPDSSAGGRSTTTRTAAGRPSTSSALPPAAG